MVDRAGRDMTWQQMMHRILDYYGTPTVSNEQQSTAYPIVCYPRLAKHMVKEDCELRRAMRRGEPVAVGPFAG
jgi:hypothetical protein